MKLEKRLSNEEIKARLVFVVAVTLSFVLVVSVLAMIYGVLFVVQPVEASQLDQEMVSILTYVLSTLAGALVGLVAGNGLKNPPKEIEE
jgi:peptidoglycan/LPS O-acetylase OafA/YrhL